MHSAFMPSPKASKSFKINNPRNKNKNTLLIILFLLPALILFLTFVVYPIFQSMYYSLFDWSGLGPAEDFVGLDNYRDILIDRVFLITIRNALFIILFSLAFQLPMAMLLAVLVGKNLPGRALFRSIFFMPYVISEVVAAIAWLFLYNPDPARGLLNAIIELIPGTSPVLWLADVNIVLPAIFVALTWKFFGFHMLLFLTGLQNIPHTIEEAAKIDGASAIKSFFFITLPLLAGTIRTSVYMSVLGSIQQFILVWIMSKGGPVNASETLATYMYRFGFVRFQLGYGSAVAIYMFLMCLIFSMIYLKMTNKPDSLTGI